MLLSVVFCVSSLFCQVSLITDSDDSIRAFRATKNSRQKTQKSKEFSHIETAFRSSKKFEDVIASYFQKAVADHHVFFIDELRCRNGGYFSGQSPIIMLKNLVLIHLDKESSNRVLGTVMGSQPIHFSAYWQPEGLCQPKIISAKDKELLQEQLLKSSLGLRR